MEPSIRVEQVSKRYAQGGFTLEPLSFTLPCGTILGLMGENGAGKTTLMKLLCNAITKDSGTIQFWGKDHIAYEKEIKSQIGVVLDEGFFYDGLNGRQISKVMGKLFSQWDEPLFYDYLDRFGLPQKQPIAEFSRGMRMKLSLSTALAHHPRLLLLDEPTSGIDPVCRNEILDLFLEFIQTEENSILFSSHITGDMEKVADHLLYIYQGKKVLYGEKEDILFGYAILKCGKEAFHRLDPKDILGYRQNQFGCEVLVSSRKAMQEKYPNAVIEGINLEQLMLFLPAENREKPAKIEKTVEGEGK